MNETFHINPIIIGVILTILALMIIIGGIKSISKISAIVVPFMVYGMPYIFAFSFEYVGLPFIMSFNTVSTATGNGWITLVTNMISAFIVRIPLAYVLAFLCELGVRGIAISIPIATAVGAIISFLFYKAGIWKKHILL